MSPTRIFAVSDLQQRYREVLDDARAGLARIRDSDGESLVVLKEARLRALDGIAAAAANLAQIESALASKPGQPLDPLDCGDWTWLRSLDAEDLAQFLGDVRRAIVIAWHEGSTVLLDEELRAWRITAEELDDPLRRSILLGPVAYEDFVPLERPEAELPGPA